MTRLQHFRSALFIILALLLLATPSAGDNSQVDIKRNKLIGYMLYKQLPSIHFSDKQVNDSLSSAAFDLYLQQLDFQKRFLRAEDIEVLKKYSLSIDDNLRSGRIVLPEIGFGLLSERVVEAEKIVQELLKGRFDTSSEDYYESDPEKVGYAETVTELRERWRKNLKAQVISVYLDLAEEQEKAEKEEGKKDDVALWQEAQEKVATRYLELFSRMKKENLQDHYDDYFNAVTRAFDPHTAYMAPAKKEDFDIHMRGSLEGIGALLREEGGFIKVVRIIPGSASARQGSLAAEDIILAVAEAQGDPVEITEMRLSEAVRLIRGPKGSEVRLTVKKPDGHIQVIPIIRDVVQIEEAFVKSEILYSKSGKKIGYVVIPSFYRDFEMSRNGGVAKNSTDDTREALERLKKENIDGLILDLRNNGGGSLVDAVDITGLFLKSRSVVQIKNSFGSRRVLEDIDDEIVYEGPMVVLVNLFSASASEILAAALQDYGRAVIVGGKHTHGKGTVQTVIDMNDNIPLLHLQRYEDLGALKVTIQKFYRVTGGSTQYKGVEPDVILPSLYSHLKSGEQYLDYSLAWDQVDAVSYVPFSAGYDIQEIQAKSLKRIQQEKGLKIIAEEAKKSQERIEQTRISLKLEDMRKKRREANVSRDLVGTQFKNYQKEQMDQYDATDNPDNSDEQGDEDKWLEDIQKDPYVGEAISIITDIQASKQGKE